MAFFSVNFAFCVFVFWSILICSLIFYIALNTIYQQPDLEKISSYECGFMPFDDARSRFEIKFYIIAILFVIFDLEISFVFAWAVAAKYTGIVGLIFFLLFFILLTIGFIIEWRRGLLDS